MQRIDENTYIDDTLVTCAEYQLFIDEMREQGKYYQPDHWTTYQFPAGEAKEPILGVRHSDAADFCDWLKYRENTEWHYRLPTTEEATYLPNKPAAGNPLGYWLEKEENQSKLWKWGPDTSSKFSWINVTSKNPRKINYKFNVENDNILPKALEKDYVSILDGKFLKELYAMQQRKTPPDISKAYEHAFEFSFFYALVLTILRHSRQSSRVSKEIIIREVGGILVSTTNSILEILQSLSLDFNRYNWRARNITIQSDQKAIVDYFTRHKAKKRFGANNRNSQVAYSEDLEFYLLFLIDIYTLQERIAGRSPAFEGIRLVKERIK